MVGTKTALPIKTAGLVIGLLASSMAWADPVRTEWTAVEQIPAGRKVEVKLYTDEPFEGALSVKGRFDSANASGVTLFLENGESRTLPMRSVRKVKVRRPFSKRVPGWSAVALAAGIAEILLYMSSEGTPQSIQNRLGAHAMTTLPAMSAFFLWPNSTVYNVPPNHRVP